MKVVGEKGGEEGRKEGRKERREGERKEGREGRRKKKESRPSIPNSQTRNYPNVHQQLNMKFHQAVPLGACMLPSN